MTRPLVLGLAAAVTIATASFAQGPVQRAGQALDNAGKGIRRGVENAVARGQTTAQERQLLNHVTQRLNLDRRLLGSAMQVVVEPGGVVVLRGSVADDVGKALAVDLTTNTVGVTRVVDELGVVREAKVIEAEPVLGVEPASRVVPVPAPSTKPVQSRAIQKP